MDIIIVLTTLPTYNAGKTIAHTLISKKLAACVNIIPSLESVYEWEGVVEETAEALLIIKTTAGCLESLKKEILSLHPYKLPEVIALNVTDGHLPYMEWIRSMTGSN